MEDDGEGEVLLFDEFGDKWLIKLDQDLLVLAVGLAKALCSPFLTVSAIAATPKHSDQLKLMPLMLLQLETPQANN